MDPPVEMRLDTSYPLQGRPAQGQVREGPGQQSVPQSREEGGSVQEQMEPGQRSIPTTPVRPAQSQDRESREAEVKEALDELLKEIVNTSPESSPFLEPVDHVLLNIPDYPRIIQNPMDLSTMQKKLDENEYTDPWKFIQDMTLMLDNCSLYNQDGGLVQSYGSNLQKLFDNKINVVMKKLGYCCGDLHYFLPLLLECCANRCTIQRDEKYLYYKHSDDVIYCVCMKCYKGKKQIKITLLPPDEGSELGGEAVPTENAIKILSKDELKEAVNQKRDLEGFVECKICCRKHHIICSKYVEALWPDGFSCKSCPPKLRNLSVTHRARYLPRTNLGDHIEMRLDSFLEEHNRRVVIRVLSNFETSFDVKPQMKARFVDTKMFPEIFQYRSKAIFAFEEVHGEDLCFFGMYVQEYGPDSPTPNKNKIYIAYMDSVHFFRPKELRTDVYHEILLGYLEYSKQRGFMTAHIWACPPKKGDDYIFNCHPSDQKFPNPKRLQQWYILMLEKGINQEIVLEYKEVLQQSIARAECLPTGLPYFDEDFWPDLIEGAITQVITSEKRRLEDECRPPPAKRNRRPKVSEKGNEIRPAPDLRTILETGLKKQKDVYFAIKLVPQECPIADTDTPINSDLMNSRESFLIMCRQHQYEFSSVRRSIHSTKCILYELHTSGKKPEEVPPHDQHSYDQETPCCSRTLGEESSTEILNSANRAEVVPVKPRQGSANVKDLLAASNSQYSKAQVVRFQTVAPPPPPPPPAPASAGVENKHPKIKTLTTCLRSLVHCAMCDNANCNYEQCSSFKYAIIHAQRCQFEEKKRCPICPELMMLCRVHAMRCELTKCNVPYCGRIRSSPPAGAPCPLQNNPGSTPLQPRLPNNFPQTNRTNVSHGPTVCYRIPNTHLLIPVPRPNINSSRSFRQQVRDSLPHTPL